MMMRCLMVALLVLAGCGATATAQTVRDQRQPTLADPEISEFRPLDRDRDSGMLGKRIDELRERIESSRRKLDQVSEETRRVGPLARMVERLQRLVTGLIWLSASVVLLLVLAAAIAGIIYRKIRRMLP